MAQRSKFSDKHFKLGPIVVDFAVVEEDGRIAHRFNHVAGVGREERRLAEACGIVQLGICES